MELATRFRRPGKEYVHHEISSFRREQGNWVYVEGLINPKPPPRQINKIVRYASWPCGSSKKHKTCCGA